MENRHRLLLIRKIFPGFLERVIERLKSATSENKELEEQMHLEDEILSVLEENANERALMKKMIEEKDQALEEKDQALEEKDQALKEVAKTLKQMGVSIEVIHEKTKLPIAIIEKL